MWSYLLWPHINKRVELSTAGAEKSVEFHTGSSIFFGVRSLDNDINPSFKTAVSFWGNTTQALGITGDHSE